MPDFPDQLSRVRLMASGDPTWDLSPNDLAALTAVLERLDAAPQWRERPTVPGAYLIQPGMGTMERFEIWNFTGNETEPRRYFGKCYGPIPPQENQA